MCFISNLFKVPASDKTISSVKAGCAASSVAPVILDTLNPAYVFNLDAAVFLSVPPAPSSTKNKSASAIPAPMSVAPVKNAVQANTFLEKVMSVPPFAGARFDPTSHRWVKPENFGQTYQARGGRKRIRGSGVGARERSVSGHGFLEELSRCDGISSQRQEQ